MTTKKNKIEMEMLKTRSIEELNMRDDECWTLEENSKKEIAKLIKDEVEVLEIYGDDEWGRKQCEVIYAYARATCAVGTAFRKRRELIEKIKNANLKKMMKSKSKSKKKKRRD